MVEQISSLKTDIKYKDTPIGRIPVDWEVAALGDICDVAGGSTPSTKNKTYWGGDIPFATPTDITNLKGREISKTKQSITREGLSSCGAHLLPAGSILLTSRATLGACAINTKPMATNQGFANLVCSQRVYNWYIYYQMMGHQKQLDSLGCGSTFREISKSNIKFLLIPIPPLPEQKKIADILATVDEAIEKTTQIVEKTEEVKTGLMQRLLTRGIGHNRFKKSEIGEIPEEWAVVKLKHVAADQRYSFVDGPFGSNLKSIHYVDRGIPVIQSQFVITGKVKPTETFCVSEEKAKELERSKVLPGDIVMAKIGVNYAASATIPEGYPEAVLSGNTMKITPNKDKVVTTFLQHLLHYFREIKAFDGIVSTTAQPAITLEGAKNLRIPLPKIFEQVKISEILDSIDDEIERESEHEEQLESLKKGLMQVLLTGKLRVAV